jgi:hypothetical protein
VRVSVVVNDVVVMVVVGRIVFNGRGVTAGLVSASLVGGPVTAGLVSASLVGVVVDDVVVVVVVGGIVTLLGSRPTVSARFLGLGLKRAGLLGLGLLGLGLLGLGLLGLGLLGLGLIRMAEFPFLSCPSVGCLILIIFLIRFRFIIFFHNADVSKGGRVVERLIVTVLALIVELLLIEKFRGVLLHGIDFGLWDRALLEA